MDLPESWQDALDRDGSFRLRGLLDAEACTRIAALWDADHRFRKTIDMAKHGYGEGRYRYFDEPLPDAVDALRRAAYPALAEAANRWQQRLGLPDRFPTELDAFLERCARAGQTRPTPLLLRYQQGGYNRLHQDRYGEVAFPLQVVVLLSPRWRGRAGEPAAGEGFEGGEFLLTETRARMQARGIVVPLEQGDALVFPNQIRPVESVRGYARATVRHGISTVTRGERIALGLIFHSAA